MKNEKFHTVMPEQQKLEAGAAGHLTHDTKHTAAHLSVGFPITMVTYHKTVWHADRRTQYVETCCVHTGTSNDWCLRNLDAALKSICLACLFAFSSSITCSTLIFPSASLPVQQPFLHHPRPFFVSLSSSQSHHWLISLLLSFCHCSFSLSSLTVHLSFHPFRVCECIRPGGSPSNRTGELVVQLPADRRGYG